MIRTLLAGTLALTLSGCPFIYDDPAPALPEGEADVGPSPDRGPEAEPGADDDTYDWVHIFDDTHEPEGLGGDGADICGVFARCDDGVHPAALGWLVLGGGEVCDGTTLDGACETGMDRSDPSAALDPGEVCRAHFENVEPPSDFVSLGLAGILSLQFERDLRGCALTIVELAEGGVESYDVYVCAGEEPSAESCLMNGQSLGYAEAGGTLTVDVPD